MKCGKCGAETSINFGDAKKILCENCDGGGDEQFPLANARKSHPETGNQAPGLAILFYVLAGLSFLGGLILAAQFMPGDPGPGYSWEPEAYLLSLVWFTAGFVQAALFAAIGRGLAYLHEIARNTAKR